MNEKKKRPKRKKLLMKTVNKFKLALACGFFSI